MKKCFRLSDYATIFSTRTRADDIASILSDYIKTLNDDDTLVIDFAKVEAISYSFLDQFLSRMVNFPMLRENRMSISGWSENLVSVIDKSLQQRNYQYSQSDSSKKRMLVLVH
jgi:hypothetical protein